MGYTPGHQMDSSWSWFMLACSFLCVFFFSLLGTSVGMAQVEMIDELKFGAGAISIMTAFAVGWSTLLGPLSGAIASVLSMRFTIIIGTVLMSLGMLMTAFSHSLPALLFFYGIMTGLGHGIAYSPAIVIIHHYFKKRLLIANGIMTSSSSFAILSLPHFHRYILDEYGWRFCFSVNAALLLHVIVFASFFKPTPLEKMSMIDVSLSSCLSRQGDASKNGSENNDDDDDEEVKNIEDDDDDDDGDGVNGKRGKAWKYDDCYYWEKEIMSSKTSRRTMARTENIKNVAEDKLFLSKESITSRKMNMLIKSTDNVSLASKTLSLSGSYSKPYIPVFINGTPKLRSPVSDLIAAHSPSLRHSIHSEDGDVSKFLRDRSVSQISSVSALTLDDPTTTTTTTTTHTATNSLLITTSTTTTTTNNNNNNNGSSLTTTASPATAVNPIPKSPTLSLKPHRFGQLRRSSSSGGRASHFGSSLVFASSDLGSSIMLPSVAIEEIKTGAGGGGGGDVTQEEMETMRARIKRIAGCKQLWLFCLNALFLMAGCGTHSIHLPSYVASKGLPSHLTANIYSVFGIVIATGRIGGGLLYTRLKLPFIPLFFILQILNGLFLMLAPFYANDVTGIFCMEAGIGLTYGQSYMLQAPIATQMVGVQDLAIAFGFIQLFNGIGYICAPILAGFIFDATGTFDVPMYIAGSFVTLGSFLTLPIWFISRKTDNKNGKNATTTKDDNDNNNDDDDDDDVGGGDNNDDGDDKDGRDDGKTKKALIGKAAKDNYNV